MVNESLVNWLKDGLSKGYSQDQLRETLGSRFSSTEVNDAFSIVILSPKEDMAALAPIPANLADNSSKSSKRPKSKKFKWIGISLVAIVLFAGIFLVLNPSQKQTFLAAPEIAQPIMGETSYIDAGLNQLAAAGFSLGEKENSIWKSSDSKYYEVFGAIGGAKLKIDGVIVETYQFENQVTQKNAMAVFTRSSLSEVIEKGNVLFVVYSNDQYFVSRMRTALG